MSENVDDRQRLAPVVDTTRELYLYSGNQCAFPDCLQSLLKENGTWNCQIAHIYGVKRTAARGEHELSNDELRAPWNLLLLCPSHHLDIDNKSLEAMKVNHESRYREAISGLERLVDVSTARLTRYPSNLQAIGLTDEEMLADNLSLVKTFVDTIAKQPVGFRDLIALILVHGEQRRDLSTNFRPPVVAPARLLAGNAAQSETELWDRARHLELAGLLDIFDVDGIWFYSLTSPVEIEIGWDIFGDLYGLAKGDRAIINRAIIDLDFSVFEG
jgi:hypothetical protein